jgi:hypothetical protein
MKKILLALAITCTAISCDYLSVIPPEQADLDDLITDNATALNHLYGCYGFLLEEIRIFPDFTSLDGGGTDECVEPQEWGHMCSLVRYNMLTPEYITADNLQTNRYPWTNLYNAIGYCNLFLKNMEETKAELDPELRQQYIAEAQYLKAYYHYKALAIFGPCPISDKLLSTNISKEEIPGRSHFDYCVDYIVGLLDEAAQSLPSVDPGPDYCGRATSIACKALKARVLLLAASPMWNGSFPDKSWKNVNFETPGYGLELVSPTFSQEKWTRARTAAQEALSAATSAGYSLFGTEASEILRTNQNIPLPAVPGKGETEEDIQFRTQVMMLRYMMTTNPAEGNKETIWGVPQVDRQFRMASMPHYILNTDVQPNGYGAWGGLSPTLYTVQHFFTEKGVIPKDDPDFTPESDWYTSAEMPEHDIIKLNVGREPRFYAWIAFDGSEYSPVLANRQPVICHMRDPQQGGYNAAKWGTRNYCITGFLNIKYVHPNLYYTGVSNKSNYTDCYYPHALLRLAELYLILAECDAWTGNEADGLENLNAIRKRAGVPEWTSGSLAAAKKTLLDAVLEERFVELYMEDHRYFDIRRYLHGKEQMGRQNFWGLDAVRTGPSFEEFNTPVLIPQPIQWHERQYLMPVPNDEVYSNPQMVQAPLY